ncbi:MAG: ion transporter [Atribacterota bacterium]
MNIKFKKRLYEILEIAAIGDRISKLFDIFIMTLITLNVIAVILATVERLNLQYQYFFRIFEIFSVTIFTIEYFLRLWTCTINKNFRNSITGRIKYIFTPFAIIDLLAILPFYLPMIIPLDLRFIRAVRLFRLFRLFKIGRYSKAAFILKKLLKDKKEELVLVVFIVFLLLIIFSSLMYFIEKEAQPEAFSNIPEAMWWGIITLTTVGYGDVYPITPLGKILGGLIAFLGIGMFALPAGILGSGLVEAIQKKGKGNEKLIEESSENELIKYPNVNKKIKKLEEKLKGAVEELELLKKMLK